MPYCQRTNLISTVEFIVITYHTKPNEITTLSQDLCDLIYLKKYPLLDFQQ